MIVYKSVQCFLCNPLGRYLPKNIRVVRYERIARLIVATVPQGDAEPVDVIAEGIEYNTPKNVRWFYEIEPPPLGTKNEFFVQIGSAAEDECGNVLGDSVGSRLRVATNGTVYLQNVKNLLWYPFRVNGPDGAVFLELGQKGIANVP